METRRADVVTRITALVNEVVDPASDDNDLARIGAALE
jgi:hypothetical protein